MSQDVLQPLLMMQRNQRKTGEWVRLQVVSCVYWVILRDMQAFSEIVLLFHEVGQALVGDVEEVDEGLHVTTL